MFNDPIYGPKMILFPCRIAEDVHPHGSSTHKSASRPMEVHDHVLQALWIYKMYVLQVPSHLCCIFMFATSCEDVNPWHEAGFDMPNITVVKAMQNLLVK